MAVHMQWRPRRIVHGNRPNHLTTAPSADEHHTFGLDVIGTAQSHPTAPRGHASSQIGALYSTRRQQQQRSLLSSASVPTVVRYEMLARPVTLQTRDGNFNSASSLNANVPGRASRSAYATKLHPERLSFHRSNDDVDYHRYDIDDYCTDSSIPLPSEAKENINLAKYERIKPLQIFENRPSVSEDFEPSRDVSSITNLRRDLSKNPKQSYPVADPCHLDVNSNRIDAEGSHTSPDIKRLEPEEIGGHPVTNEADGRARSFTIPHRHQIEVCRDGQQKIYPDDHFDEPTFHRGGIFRQGKPPTDWWNESVKGGRKSKGKSLSAGTASLLESLSQRMTRAIPSKTQAGIFTAEANRRRASVQSAWSELQVVGHSVGFDGKMSPSFGLRVPPSSGCGSRRSVAAEKLQERPPSSVDDDAFGTTLYVNVDSYEVESKKDLYEERITPSLDLNLHQQDTGDVHHTSARTPRGGIANLTSPSCNGRSHHVAGSATSPTYRTGWQPTSARQSRTPTSAVATPSSARCAESPGRHSNQDSLSSSRVRQNSKNGLPVSELPSLMVLKISNGNVTRVSNADTISPTENDGVFSPRSPIEVFTRNGSLSPAARVENGCVTKSAGSRITTPDTNESATAPKPHLNNGISRLSEKPNGLESSPCEEKFVNRVTICLSPRSETPVTRAVRAQSRNSPRSVDDGSNSSGSESSSCNLKSNGMKQSNGEIVSEMSTTSPVKLEVDMRPSFRAESDDDLRSNGNVDCCNGVAENRSEMGDFVDHATSLPAIIEVPTENGDGGATCDAPEVTEIKDGRFFLQIVQTQEDKINALCVTAEKDLDGTIPDEAAGKVRAAVGKAHLLTAKKFRQFRDLCDKNLTQDESEQFKTTTQDLAGFWDLVTIQVEDVHNMFVELDALRSNGWKEIKLPEASAVPTSPITRSATHAPSSAVKHQQSGAAKPASKSPGKSDAVKAREEARKRLMMAKAAGRQRKASETESDEVQIFTV